FPCDKSLHFGLEVTELILVRGNKSKHIPIHTRGSSSRIQEFYNRSQSFAAVFPVGTSEAVFRPEDDQSCILFIRDVVRRYRTDMQAGERILSAQLSKPCFNLHHYVFIRDL